MKLSLLIPLLVLAATPYSIAQNEAASLLQNGSLEGGSTTGWPVGKGVSVEEEAGNYFLRLKAEEPGIQIQAHRIIKLVSGVQKLNVRFRVRFEEITPGAQAWHRGSVIMHFKDANGQVLKPDPAPFAFKGTSDGWVDKAVLLEVPADAASLEFMPALFQVAQGTLDIDDMLIIPE